jgi:hypothetical protein
VQISSHIPSLAQRRYAILNWIFGLNWLGYHLYFSFLPLLLSGKILFYKARLEMNMTKPFLYKMYV